MSLNQSEGSTEKLSREYKSLMNAAKESKIISECVSIDKVRKSRKDVYESSLQTSPIDVKNDRSRTSSNNSTSSDVSSKNLDAKRSMRSQNIEFVLKQKKFMKSLTGRSSPELLIDDDTGKEISKDDKANIVNVVDKSGRRMDPFCWHCHGEGSQMFCSICPRSYHTKCPSSKVLTLSPGSAWACPECVVCMNADNTDKRSPIMRRLTVNKLSQLLKFALDKMAEVPGSKPFEDKVDLELFPQYSKYIVHPMDLKQLRQNIIAGGYGSTEAFLADAKWILHNSIIFNTVHAKLTTVAKNILKVCRTQLNEINVCHECYQAANTRSDWFVQTCAKPHVLLWAKLKGFPYWPAKAMAISNTGLVDVRFFGAHDRTWLRPRDCYLYSLKDPNPNNKQRKNEILVAMQEITEHINKLTIRFGTFRPAAFKTPYSPHSEEVFLKMMLPNYIPDETVPTKVIFPSSPYGESKSSNMTKNKNSSSQPTSSVSQIKSDLQPKVMLTAFSKKLNRNIYTEGYVDEKPKSGPSTSKLSERKSFDLDEHELEVGEVISTYQRKSNPERVRSKSSSRKMEDSEIKQAALKRTKRSQSVCVASSEMGDEDDSEDNSIINVSTSDTMDNSSVHSEKLVLEIPVDDEPSEHSNKRKRTLSEEGNSNKKSKGSSEELSAETEIPVQSEIRNRRMSVDSRLMMCYRRALASKSSELSSVDDVNDETKVTSTTETKLSNDESKITDIVSTIETKLANDKTQITDNGLTTETILENDESKITENVLTAQTTLGNDESVQITSEDLPNRIEDVNVKIPECHEPTMESSQSDENQKQPSSPNITSIQSTNTSTPIIPNGLEMVGLESVVSMSKNFTNSTSILPKKRLISNLQEDTIKKSPPKKNVINTSNVSQSESIPKAICSSDPCETNSSKIKQGTDTSILPSSGPVSDNTLLAKPLPKTNISTLTTYLENDKVVQSLEDIASEPKKDCNSSKISLSASESAQKSLKENKPSDKVPDECAGKIDLPYETVEAVTKEPEKSVTDIQNKEIFVNSLRLRPSDNINQKQSVKSSQLLTRNMTNSIINGHTSTVANTTIKRITLNKNKSPTKNKSPEKTTHENNKETRGDNGNDSITEETSKTSSPKKDIVSKSNLKTNESSGEFLKLVPSVNLINVNNKRKSLPTPNIAKKTKMDVAKKAVSAKEPLKLMPVQGKNIRIVNTDLTHISGLNNKISNVNKNNNHVVNSPTQNVNTELSAMNSMVFIPSESTQNSNKSQDNVQSASDSSSSANGPTLTFTSPTSLTLGNGSSNLVLRPLQSLLADSATQSTPSSSTNTNSVRVVSSAFLMNPSPTNANSDSTPPQDNSTASIPPASAGPCSKMIADLSFKVMENVLHSLMETLQTETTNGNLVTQNFLLRLELEKVKWESRTKQKELQHNTDIRIKEIQACYEADKTKSIAELRKQAEIEKLIAVRETKKKQWCALCPREAELYCCRNTAYCEYSCQKAHWPEHISVCQQSNNPRLASGGTLPALGNLVSNAVGNRKNIIIKHVSTSSSAGLFKNVNTFTTSSSIQSKSPAYKLVVNPVISNSSLSNSGSTPVPTVILSQQIFNHDSNGDAHKKSSQQNIGDIPSKTL